MQQDWCCLSRGRRLRAAREWRRCGASPLPLDGAQLRAAGRRAWPQARPHLLAPIPSPAQGLHLPLCPGCRFEGGKQVMRQKYSMMQLPVGPVEDQLALAVDTVGQLSLGLGVGEAVAAADVEDLAAVLAVVWAEASREQVLASISGREGRAGLYS